MKMLLQHLLSVGREDKEENRELFSLNLRRNVLQEEIPIQYTQEDAIKALQEMTQRLMAALRTHYGTHPEFYAYDNLGPYGDGYIKISGILRQQQVPEVVAFVRGYLARETEK